MKTYAIDPLQRSRLIKRLILKLALITGAALLAALVVALLVIQQSGNAFNVAYLAVAGIALVVVSVISGIRIYSQARVYGNGLDSIRILLGAERVDKMQEGAAAVRINRTEVTALIENENGVLVMTHDRTRFLWVPVQLLDYAGARADLERWMPIRRLPPCPAINSSILTVVWGIGTAFCVGVLLFSTTPWQALTAGIATMAIYVFVYRLLRRQGQVDMKFRRTYSGILMFLIIVVTIKLLMTLGPMLTAQ